MKKFFLILCSVLLLLLYFDIFRDGREEFFIIPAGDPRGVSYIGVVQLPRERVTLVFEEDFYNTYHVVSVFVKDRVTIPKRRGARFGACMVETGKQAGQLFI